MLDPGAKEWLHRLLGSNVRFDEPLARHTSLRIGGPADALVRPESEAQLKALLQWARETRTPYFVIGAGTNLLVRDGGIRGLVIHLARVAGTLDWETQGGQVHVRAGAAIPTRRICRVALQQGWRGFNFALGIPGTLGGAVLMNAGTAHGAMADVLEAVTFMLPAGAKVRLTRDTIEARYRHLILPAEVMESTTGPGILLAADLALALGERTVIRHQARKLMARRVKGQSAKEASAGCFFRNPSDRQPAGRLIDAAGLKGMRVGDAQVSHRHANFIINLGRASAKEVLALAAQVQERVRIHSGVLLTPEVRIVGEEETNPEKPV
ncbi:MAG: UDP-N-acetylmuramate dehydrogenase [Desulfobacteraceae bacterium]|jgi:UDP-N-acetylmuramate dehydrogenase